MKRTAIKTLNDIKDRCYVDERGCWIWSGCMANGKVPMANIGNRQLVTVMRFAYCLKNKVPLESLAGLRVWSSKRECRDVNPDHAMVGTAADHNRWRAEGGRLKGEHRRIISTKSRDKIGRRYTPAQIVEIRSSDETERALAERFGCTPALIGYIRRGKIYNTTVAAASVFSWAVAA